MSTRNKHDGGCAFPVWDATAMHRIGMAASQDIADSAERDREYIQATAEAAQGLSKRDYFAGVALASGEASNWRDSDYRPVDGLTLIENTARCAYEYADAMIKAREAKS